MSNDINIQIILEKTPAVGTSTDHDTEVTQQKHTWQGDNVAGSKTINNISIKVVPPESQSITDDQKKNQKEDSDSDIKCETKQRLSQTKPIETTTSKESKIKNAEEFTQIEEEQKLNYHKLEEYLRMKNWQKADDETLQLLINSLDRSKKSDLINFSIQTIENLSNETVSQIDKLWKQYSEDRFGFSIQREIYLNLDSNSSEKLDMADNYDKWINFCNLIGWRKENIWVSLQNLYKTIDYYDCEKFEGCLPSYRLFTKDKNYCSTHRFRTHFGEILSKFESH